MSFPFRLNVRPDLFSHLVKHLRSVVEGFPDERTGETTYSMADAALGAFSVFVTQSPSFLDFQPRRGIERNRVRRRRRHAWPPDLRP